MIKVKEHFSTVTTNEVAQFYAGVKIAYEQYMADGPGAEGTSLKDGDILLLNYKETIQALNKKREELVHAQQLFNLPITAYPELVEIED
jgi:dynein heavy chain